MSDPPSPLEHLDVLIVGAGLSGISAAWHIGHDAGLERWAVVEARSAMGGTWDLFRYPGIRSDSDMFTLGYRFHPWRAREAIADGPAILAYIEETAERYGIEERIRFQHRLIIAEWSSGEGRWTVTLEVGPERRREQLTCSFIYGCTGYYRYDRGYTPDWPDLDRFRGTVLHPQHWPEEVDLAGRRVVIIGSGATAVTLLPALAQAPDPPSHVTMLQRSPTWIVSQPTRDVIANRLRRHLPERLSYTLARWKNVLRQMFFFNLSRRWPGVMASIIRADQRARLGDGYDFDAHLSPRYDPWDERLCVAPDGDFFSAIQSGRASIVTDRISGFTEEGIRLESGEVLKTDVIVTATGLAVEILSGVRLVVDGEDVDLAARVTYKGMMYSDIPNLASTFGYTNASWTLKADLTAQHVCRILKRMRRIGSTRVVPRVLDDGMTREPALDLSSGYVKRALPVLPTQGSRAPWKVHQNYVKDLVALRFGRVDEPELEFSDPTRDD